MRIVSTARADIVKRLLPFLALCAASPFPAQATNWEYTRVGDDARKTLTVSKRAGREVVPVRQFCFALGCSVLFQWANHRAFLQNPAEHLGAIVSPLASFAVVDGEVVDFEPGILEDDVEGYLIPVPLAVELAHRLKLGKVFTRRYQETLVGEPRPYKRELHTLIIDPGHGGTDFGTGFGGIFEKDVAVLYAMQLREEIKRQLPEVNVVLTREDDRFVSLPDRAKLANSSNASLFLSIHVNHAPDAKVEGTESYILSPDATDDEAKKLALLENDTWLKSAKISEAGNDIRKILIDMEQEKYIQDSALAASMVMQEMAALEKRRGLRSRGVKQAMFYVLSQVAMPSMLIEMGFLSNTGDRSRMMNVEFRDDFVQALVTALKRYSEPTRRN